MPHSKHYHHHKCDVRLCSTIHRHLETKHNGELNKIYFSWGHLVTKKNDLGTTNSLRLIERWSLPILYSGVALCHPSMGRVGVTVYNLDPHLTESGHKIANLNPYVGPKR